MPSSGLTCDNQSPSWSYVPRSLGPQEKAKMPPLDPPPSHLFSDSLPVFVLVRGQSDWYTHVHDLPPQIGTCYPNDASPPFAKEIDGKDGSWSLPLPDKGVEPIVMHDQDRYAAP